jgi:hypothetical protein
MISGTGMRPGDIVTASNGKTIEVSVYVYLYGNMTSVFPYFAYLDFVLITTV